MVYAIFQEYSYEVYGGKVFSSMEEAVKVAEQRAGHAAEVVEDDHAEIGEFYIKRLDVV